MQQAAAEGSRVASKVASLEVAIRSHHTCIQLTLQAVIAHQNTQLAASVSIDAMQQSVSRVAALDKQVAELKRELADAKQVSMSCLGQHSSCIDSSTRPRCATLRRWRTRSATWRRDRHRFAAVRRITPPTCRSGRPCCNRFCARRSRRRARSWTSTRGTGGRCSTRRCVVVKGVTGLHGAEYGGGWLPSRAGQHARRVARAAAPRHPHSCRRCTVLHRDIVIGIY